MTPKEMDSMAKKAMLERDIPFIQEPQTNPFEKFWQMQMFFNQDFAIESLKTYKNRKWRKLVVWYQEASVEMIPNDDVIKELQSDYSASWSGAVKYSSQLDFSVNTWSTYTTESSWKQDTAPNKIEIIKPGIYEIEFAYWLNSIVNLSAVRIAIEKNGTEIFQDKQERTTPPLTLSWYRKKKVQLVKWDKLEFILSANYSWSGSVTVDKTYTYRSINYFKSNR